ncbi:MAG TPA: SIS domain-containing protein [Bacillota bacterium]|nr:SIS domain-containing protein [Bacillota bacterium]HPJ85990.1 SIS domain-containing protein [Bacillota bacterium]HPQ61989.1 SIS domain-containing protein [Bacillota bacterium]
MCFMDIEIREEPEILQNARDKNIKTIKAVAHEFSKRNIRKIVLAARGSSDHAGVYFKYLSEIVLGIPVSLSAPSVVTMYDGKLDLSDTLTIGVSQSGEAKDVLAVIERANNQHAVTVSLTNDPTSPLATKAAYHLDLSAGIEKSVAATKTFIAEMYLLALFVKELSGSPELAQEMEMLPELLENVLELDQKIAVLAAKLEDMEDCFVIGRGLSDAIALEIALKLQETSYVRAFGYATSDFRHGPFALVDKGSVAIILALEDETFPDSEDMVKRLNEAKARIVVFTDNADFPVSDKIVLPKSGKYTKPFLFAAAGQLFSLYLAKAKGLNPDNPRNLKKVTITR